MRRLLVLGLALLAVAAAALAVRQWRKRPPAPRRIAAHLAFPRAGGGGLPLRAVPAFPGVVFAEPLFLAAAPGDPGHVYVVEKRGRILRLARQGGRPEVFLDLSARVATEDAEEGLLGLAFDTDYARSRALYVHYSASPPRRSVISRFRGADEEVILEVPQPYGNHNGGMLAFGPDGFLYVGLGDGGSGGDPHGHGQDLTTLLGSILRIDPRGGSPYAVPKDNPFADGKGGARPEIWAYGLRNPWRFSFGPDGRLWAGDVGQHRREEIDLIVRGGNYGWNVFEGGERYGWRNALASADGMIPPVHDYPHAPLASVIGGYVYRGPGLPGHRGRYFFGDHVTGQVWTLAEEAGGASVRPVAFVPGLSSFGEDEDLELYAVSLQGTIYRLLERSEDFEEPPPRLSETGLFADTSGLGPAPSLLPYDVRHPAWHDGASARRWIALPEEGAIGTDAQGNWTFPPGTALVMHLERDGRRLETRVLFRDDDGWAAYSYRWNAQGTDALRGSDRIERDGWVYPGTADCFACHNDPAGRALGVRASQLDFTFAYADKARNQLDLWTDLGLLDRAPPRAAPLAARDGDEPLEERARAYLDVNCAPCHRPGGFNPSPMDLRRGVPRDRMRIVDAPPREPPTDGLPDRLLAPGRPEESQLWRRLHAEGDARMPPFAGRTDPLGDELLRRWIAGR